MTFRCAGFLTAFGPKSLNAFMLPVRPELAKLAAGRTESTSQRPWRFLSSMLKIIAPTLAPRRGWSMTSATTSPLSAKSTVQPKWLPLAG